MIPEFNQAGVLPPFLSAHGPANPDGVAPYTVSISELVYHYSYSPERNKILQGLLDYREHMRSAGITNGIQWVDGSFIEDVEKTRARAPNDVDLVTFAHRPDPDLEKWEKLFLENQELFNPEKCKESYICDAYYVDLDLPAINIVNQTRYWFGLFSHQRETFLWKGLLEIPLLSDDSEAQTILLNGGRGNA